jgi:hypothetical protein
VFVESGRRRERDRKSEKEVYDWLTNEMGIVPNPSTLTAAIYANNLDLVKYLIEELHIELPDIIMLHTSFAGDVINNGAYDTARYLFSTGLTRRTDSHTMYSIIDVIENAGTMDYFVNALWKPNVYQVITMSIEFYRSLAPSSVRKMNMLVRSLRADLRENVLKRVWNDTTPSSVWLKDIILSNRDEV